MRDLRLAKLADVLVNYSVAVKKNDLVLIRGATATEPLVIEIFRSVVEAGGRPHVSLFLEEGEEILLKQGSRAQLETVDPLRLHQMETIDCLVSLWGGRNTRNLTHCDPAKQAMYSKSRQPVLDRLLARAAKKQLRWVGTEAPTESAAQDADMSLSEFEDFLFSAGFIDRKDPAAVWRSMRTAQQRMCDYLSRCRELRFRNGDGTDLRVGIEGRTWINCDGKENFPDGEVFTGPIEDATEGTVQYRFPAVHGGREVTDIRLKFRSGRVVDCSASKGEEFLTAMLDQDKGARVLGEIAIGTNYNITRYMKNTLFDEKIGGTFHAALGKAYPESGGKNESALHWDMVCEMRKDGVIEADGKVISRKGRFTNRGWPQP